MDQKTIDTYNQLAKEYDEEVADSWERFPRTFLDEFIRRAGKRVLDVGSGSGRDGLILAHAGKEVVCLDASEAMVRMCLEHGLEAVLGDFSALPFPDASFDAVWAYTALLHVPKAEVERPLAEIRRVLKANGILGIGMIEGDTEGYRNSSGVAEPRWFSFYAKEELEELLQQHGFQVQYFESFMPRTKNYLNFIAEKL